MHVVDAQNLLKTAGECARLITAMDECLLALGGKRRTLEEQAISDYFVRLVSTYAQIITLLHQNLRCESTPAFNEAVIEVDSINAEFNSDVSELLKAIRHNYNYLEQYFEYDFYARLSQERIYAERLEAVNKKLHDNASATK